MIAFLAIVKLTCKSAVRSHVFQILLGVLIFTIIALPMTVVGDGTAHAHIQVSLQYCLGTVSFLLSISTIWLGCFVMGSDVESYQLHMVITKPVSRMKLWLGKCTGIIVVHAVLLLISTGLVYGLILLQFYDPGYITNLKFPALVISIISLSIFIIAFVISCSALIIGRLNSALSWSGKWVSKVGFFALAASLIFYVIHLLVPVEVKRQSFSVQEKQRIKSEVLVGRRVFMPQILDTGKITKNLFTRRLKELAKQNKKLPEPAKRTLLIEIRKQVLASIGEVRAGQTYIWLYAGLQKNGNNPLFLRYRTYVGKVSSKEQRETMGIWAARINLPVQVRPNMKKGSKQPQKTRAAFSPRTNYPERIMCGIFNEIVMSSFIINENGNAMVAFANYDPQGKTLFFQVSDGPKLLVKVTGFLGNYSRGVFMIFAKIVFLAGLSCAIGGVISIPTAIFSVISYLLFGVFSTYLIGIDDKMAALGGPSSSTAYDIIGNVVSRILMFIIIPMQKFEVSYLLASGELIEFSYIGKVLIFDLFLKSICILTLGIWLYKRREMGLVIRK